MNLKVVRDQAAFFMMRSRIWGGMRWIASATRPGIGVAMATRTHSVSEMTRPAMAVASSEMVIGVWYRWPCRLRAQVGDGLKTVQHGRGQQKGEDGQRTDGDQQHVDGARQVLAAAALRALRQVMIVVCAHRRREAGDVVSPAGQNVSNDRVCAARFIQAARSRSS